MSVKSWRTFVVLMAIGLLGCRSGSDDSAQHAARGAKRSVAESPTVDAIDEQGLRKLIGERNGKVLFLNIWATWCAPCVEEFPDLIRLHRELRDQQVEVVGISADYEDELESKIIPFLKKHNVPFRNFVASFKRQEDFINAVERSWSGALPVSLVFDSLGEKRYFHLGKGTFEHFKREIDKSMGGL